jgi:hypothetical protein
VISTQSSLELQNLLQNYNNQVNVKESLVTA